MHHATLKSMKTKHQFNKIQTLTLALAAGAFVMSTFSLWQNYNENELRLLSEESFATSHIDHATRISRIEMCIEQNINPCNLSDTMQPVDLSTEK